MPPTSPITSELLNIYVIWLTIAATPLVFADYYISLSLAKLAFAAGTVIIVRKVGKQAVKLYAKMGNNRQFLVCMACFF